MKNANLRKIQEAAGDQPMHVILKELSVFLAEAGDHDSHDAALAGEEEHRKMHALQDAASYVAVAARICQDGDV